MRELVGLAVPYGQTGVSAGRRTRFAPGAVEVPARTTVLLEHDQAQRLGRIGTAVDGSAGLRVVIRLRPARAAWVMARVVDGTLTGLSPGVEWAAGDVVLDPEHPATYLVRRAVLRELTVTATPAFPGARIEGW